MRKTHVRRSAEQWHQILEELAASRLDGRTFCGKSVEPGLKVQDRVSHMDFLTLTLSRPVRGVFTPQ